MYKIAFLINIKPSGRHLIIYILLGITESPTSLQNDSSECQIEVMNKTLAAASG